MSDPVGHDVDDNASEAMDEDRLRVDPLEDGIDPPEHWAAADRFGTTPREQREGESLDQKLSEEQPDVEPPGMPERPVAATPASQLSESLDDVEGDVEPVAPVEASGGVPASDRGEAADEAGGSVAEAIRTPPGDPRAD